MKLAWSHLNIFALMMLAGYVVAFADATKLMKNKFNIEKYVSDFRKLLTTPAWPMYIALFSAVPFFAFLTIVQSKISWYFATIVPLLTLIIPYLYMRITLKPLRMIILVVIVGSFMIRFIPATYALNITSQNDPDNVKVARCIAPLQSSSVSMLVNAQERQNRNVLEAAQQQTETSFIYGGSPAFVYYSGKHVEYYYKVEQYLIDSMKHQLVVVSQADIDSSIDVANTTKKYVPVPECTFGEWRVFSSN